MHWDEELRFFLITSAARMHECFGRAGGRRCLRSMQRVRASGLLVRPSQHAKCVRCWQHRPDVGTHAQHPQLCGRCISNLGPGEAPEVCLNTQAVARPSSMLGRLELVTRRRSRRDPGSNVESLDRAAFQLRREPRAAAGARHHAACTTPARPSASWPMPRAGSAGSSRALRSSSGSVLCVWLRRINAPHAVAAGARPVLDLAGALGNLIDRLRLGHVIDFIEAHWKDASFPAFNVADSAITVGAALIIARCLARGTTQEILDANRARQSPRLLRRCRSGHRDRRARARAFRRADLRTPRGGAQPLRRRSAARPGCGVRRGARRGAGRVRP